MPHAVFCTPAAGAAAARRFRAAAFPIAFTALVIVASVNPSSGERSAAGAPALRTSSDSLVGALVDSLDTSRIRQTVRDLSGADSVTIGGRRERILTRHAYTPGKELAVSYLVERITAIGYAPRVQPFILSVEHADLLGVAVSRGLDTVWTAGGDGRVYRATAAGGWSRFDRCSNVGNIVRALDVDAAGRLWAACAIPSSPAGALFFSIDGGATWQSPATTGSVLQLYCIDFRDDRFGIAGGSQGTVLSTGDWGRTWNAQDPAKFLYQDILGCAASDSMHFWLVTGGGDLFESTNPWIGWTDRYLGPVSLFGIDFYGRMRGVIVGDNAAFYTVDGGATWIPAVLGASLQSVHMLDSLTAVAGGGAGEIWRSSDGGASWSRLAPSCSDAVDVMHVAASADGRCWLAGRDLVRRLDTADPLLACERYVFTDTILGKNVVFSHEGTVNPQRRFFLTAHFDSYAGTSSPLCAPGADDNATGVAAVLETARLVHGARTRYSIDFVLFDGEEVGLKGSRAFAAGLPVGPVYEGAVNLDMLGYDTGNPGSLIVRAREEAGDYALADSAEAAISRFGLSIIAEKNYSAPLASDQYAFWEIGVPAILLIEGVRGQLTPYYHSCNDIADNLIYPFFNECAKAAVGTMALLAGLMPDSIVVRRIAMEQNRPNPFSARTRISYSLPWPTAVEIMLFDVSGRRIALLESKRMSAGPHELEWDGRDEAGRLVSSGVYIVRLAARGQSVTRKLVIVR